MSDSANAHYSIKNRQELIEQILELQSRIEAYESTSRITQSQKARSWGRQLLIWALLGRRLSNALSKLLLAVRDERRPYLGSELAATLEAISRKIMGYKRWILTLGLMAALPGLISVYLLRQQTQTVERIKENTLNDITNNERVILLGTLYNTYDKSELGMLTTPMSSAPNRRKAVFKLIERDSSTLQKLEASDILRLNHMVDLSIAPLNDVDFSPINNQQPFHFKDVGFVNSNFENASFRSCSFDHVWFSSAYLWRTDFRGCRFEDVAFDQASIMGADFGEATFVNCDFNGAVFDAETIWPEGFDPAQHGAQKMEVNQ